MNYKEGYLRMVGLVTHLVAVIRLTGTAVRVSRLEYEITRLFFEAYGRFESVLLPE